MVKQKSLVEKYRPKTLDEIKGQDEVVKVVRNLIDRYKKYGEKITNLLLVGPQGTGKSSLAQVIARELFGESWKQHYMELNASVSKDTLITVKINDKVKTLTFSDLDRLYIPDCNDDVVVQVNNLKVLTIDKDLNPVWKPVKYLIRHKASKLLKITLDSGCQIKLTGNHSVMKLYKDNLVDIDAKDLTIGEKLIHISEYDNNIEFTKIVDIEAVDYNDYVYDISVLGNEMFFAGNIPILLHNSDERGIEVIRGKVKMASKSAIERIIFLDEADALTQDSQFALRRIMETASDSVFFILSCNYINKIIPPIQDRCTILYFNKIPPETLLDIVLDVLMKEKVKPIVDGEIPDDIVNALSLLVEYADGSARKALNELEKMIIIKDGEKWITSETIIRTLPADISKQMIEAALNDKLDEAIKLLEDTYIENKLSPEFLINRLWKVCKEELDDKYIKAIAFRELARCEETIIKYGCNPLIQFGRFVSSIWLAKYAR